MHWRVSIAALENVQDLSFRPLKGSLCKPHRRSN